MEFGHDVLTLPALSLRDERRDRIEPFVLCGLERSQILSGEAKSLALLSVLAVAANRCSPQYLLLLVCAAVRPYCCSRAAPNGVLAHRSPASSSKRKRCSSLLHRGARRKVLVVNVIARAHIRSDAVGDQARALLEYAVARIREIDVSGEALLMSVHLTLSAERARCLHSVHSAPRRHVWLLTALVGLSSTRRRRRYS